MFCHYCILGDCGQLYWETMDRLGALHSQIRDRRGQTVPQATDTYSRFGPWNAKPQYARNLIESQCLEFVMVETVAICVAVFRLRPHIVWGVYFQSYLQAFSGLFHLAPPLHLTFWWEVKANWMFRAVWSCQSHSCSEGHTPPSQSSCAYDEIGEILNTSPCVVTSYIWLSVQSYVKNGMQPMFKDQSVCVTSICQSVCPTPRLVIVSDTSVVYLGVNI